MNKDSGDKPSKVAKMVTFQTSSMGRVINSWLLSFYECISDLKPDSITDHFKIIFPTDKYIEKTHLGTD